MAWWREAIECGSVETPLLAALGDVVDDDAARVALAGMAEAQRFWLYADAVESVNDLEGLLGETFGAHFAVWLRLLDPTPHPRTAEAAGFSGVALGLARIVAARAAVVGRERSLMPRDLVYEAGDGPALRLLDLSRYREASARAAIADLPEGSKPALLPLATAQPLRRRARAGPDLGAVLSPLSQLLAVTRAGVFGLRS